MLSNYHWCVGKKNSSFANFDLWVGSWGLQMCCFVRWEKKQNKFPRTAPTYQRSTKPINPFFVIISIFLYRINVSSFDFVYTCIQRASICKVGDCGRQTYQTNTILKWATTVEFTTVSPILYIHCWQLGFIHLV
ncbi:MAG: hypothetical protein PHI52_04885 [Bacteroidales bacterium]|nr:hypothetical protein [Bacteroidales bacterium]